MFIIYFTYQVLHFASLLVCKSAVFISCSWSLTNCSFSLCSFITEFRLLMATSFICMVPLHDSSSSSLDFRSFVILFASVSFCFFSAFRSFFSLCKLKKKLHCFSWGDVVIIAYISQINVGFSCVCPVQYWS